MMNEHSKMYENILYWYTHDMWTAKQVRNAVKKNKITQAECDEILASKVVSANG